MRQLTASAVTAFTAASCALHPQWFEQISVDQVLSGLEWPQVPGNLDTVQRADGTYVQTAFKSCPQFFPQQHAPMVPEAPVLRELCFDDFAILHSGQTKTPVFVVERLSRQKLLRAAAFGRTDRFYAEARLPRHERAELADYRGSGYSRGHMAPAGDMYTEQGMAQSFSLANMVPQNQRHNAGAWSQIENDTRKYVLRALGDVYVYTGPVFQPAPTTIGPGKVAVPTYLYKLVYDSHTGKSWVHWHENSETSRAGPPITYPEFVRRSGLHLLPKLSSAPF